MGESPIQGSSLFELVPRVANVPPWVLKTKDARWTEEDLKSLKYVDDSINIEKFNLRAVPMLQEEGRFIKIAHLDRTRMLLKHVTKRANESGMLVNNSKTSLMCVSAARSFEPRVGIDRGGTRVEGSTSMKILGVILDNDCTFCSHSRAVVRKLRARTWTLPKLRKAGMNHEQLLKTYKGLIRPQAEYATQVWHSMITCEQAAAIERQQTLALKHIFGNKLSASKLQVKADIDLLSKRRERFCLSFARKCFDNPRCNGWFLEQSRPLYARRIVVQNRRYLEPISRTDRHFNSPKTFVEDC